MNEEYAQFIEENKTTLVKYVVEEVSERKIPSYSSRPINQLGELVAPVFDVIARYLRNGDPTEYRSFIHDMTLDRLKNGFKVDDVYTMAGIIRNAIERVVNEQLTAPEQARQKERFLRRLQGIQTLAQSTQIAAQFDLNKDNK